MLNECLLTFSVLIIKVGSQCIDINGRPISEDAHYVPGPDACTLCVCGNSMPNMCKAVLCSPPTECQSFSRVGKSCCNFTCLDDSLHKREDFSNDLGLRLLVSAAAALVSLSLLFLLIHRLRQRKSIERRPPNLRAERRGLGYLGYLPENYYAGADGFDRHIEFHYEEAPSPMSLWKPPGESCLPRGEAPPPYEEAVAHSRPELIITASSTLPNISHRTIPLNLTAPGTIRIIHPQQRRSYQEAGMVTLPRTSGKIDSSSTVHINITGCGFHTVHNMGAAAQVPSPELAEDTVSNYELHENTPVLSVVASDTLASEEYSANCAGLSAAVDADDGDDYRPECENCKSSPTRCSKYYEEEDHMDPPETMTLQRMSRESDDGEDPYLRAGASGSVTLPIKCKQPRRVLGSREGWFTTMPESSSEDEFM